MPNSDYMRTVLLRTPSPIQIASPPPQNAPNRRTRRQRLNRDQRVEIVTLYKHHQPRLTQKEITRRLGVTPRVVAYTLTERAGKVTPQHLFRSPPLLRG